MTEFKRTHYFRLANGIEVKIQMPEEVWQERIVPLVRANRHPREMDKVYCDIVRESLGVTTVGDDYVEYLPEISPNYHVILAHKSLDQEVFWDPENLVRIEGCQITSVIPKIVKGLVQVRLIDASVVWVNLAILDRKTIEKLMSS